MGAIEQIIGPHHRQAASLFDGTFKGGQVEFAQGALVDDGIHAVAIEFLVIAGEMFDIGGHIVLLNGANNFNAQGANVMGIFADVFKISPA